MLSSEQLKKITAEARPIIERQLDDAERLAGLRDVVANAGGDWGQLKALIKAQIKDENDDAGDGKHVSKILAKANYATAYADMLGLSKMNEKNSFDPYTGEIIESHAKATIGKAAEVGASERQVTGSASADGVASRLSVGSGSDAPIPTPDDGGDTAEPDSGLDLHGEVASFQQDGAEVARGAHNPEVAGSIPAPATNFDQADLTDKTAEPSGSAAPSVNALCLKAKRGEQCIFGHKGYSCADCNYAWAIDRVKKREAA